LVLSRLFRGKFLAGLQDLYDAGQLTVPLGSNDPSAAVAFQRLKDKLYQIDWVVFSKKPLGGPEHVFAYLGRYTHRVAISNQRLISFDDKGVCFATKDGNTATVPPVEFLRRFLMHVLPYRFVKIRHYGLMAPANVNDRLEVARQLLTPSKAANDDSDDTEPSRPDITTLPWQDILLHLTGIDLNACPACGSTNLLRYAIAQSRAPPLETS
jgi:hypothetical protein